MVAGSVVEFVVLEQDPGVAKPGAGDKEEIENGALVLSMVPSGFSVIVDQVKVLDGAGGHEVGC